MDSNLTDDTSDLSVYYDVINYSSSSSLLWLACWVLTVDTAARLNPSVPVEGCWQVDIYTQFAQGRIIYRDTSVIIFKVKTMATTAAASHEFSILQIARLV